MVLSSFLKWSWIAARISILHLWQSLEMTSASLLLARPLGLIRTTGESWLCVQRVKRKHWKMRGTGWKVHRDFCHKERFISPLLWGAGQCKRSWLSPSRVLCYTHLRHPPEATWWCTHKDKTSGCCVHEVWTYSSWRAQDFLLTWKLPWTSGQHKEWI